MAPSVVCAVSKRRSRTRVVSRKAAVLLLFLSSLLPRWSAAAFVPAGKGVRIPANAAIPDNLSSETLDSLTSALLSPDASVGHSSVVGSDVMDKITLMGQNFANINWKEDLRLEDIDRALGISANERLYTAALVLFVGVGQHRAGREAYKAELVNKLASGEMSTEEVMADITTAAEAAIAHKLEVERILEKAKAEAEERRLNEAAKEAEAKLAIEEKRFEKQRLARENKEAAMKRIEEMRAKAQQEKEEKRAMAFKKKEEAERRIVEAKAAAEEKRRLAKEKKIEEQERKKLEQARIRQEAKAAKEVKLLEQKLKKEEQARIREEAKAAKLLEQKHKKEEQTRIREETKAAKEAKVMEQKRAKEEQAQIRVEPIEAKREEERAIKKRIREKAKAVESTKKQKQEEKPGNEQKEEEEVTIVVEKQSEIKKKSKELAVTIKAAVRASPLAKIIASENGLDVSLVAPGSGKDGRVLADDVRAFIAKVDSVPTYFFAANATAA